MEKDLKVGGLRNSVVSSDDDDDDDNPEHILDEWLSELDVLSAGLNTSVESKNESFTNFLRPLSHEITTPRIDSYRFSMANLEETQDVDLDAILGELCALGNKCDEEIGKTANMLYSKITKSNIHPSEATSIEEHIPSPLLPHSQHRTDSPDNDSAFSDTLSMLSGESSASSGVSAALKNQNNLNSNIQKDAASQLKSEKIRLALEKMKEAAVKKLFIKAFSMDGSSKSLLVDEKMTCGYVTRLLADKNHVQMEPKWAIVEQLNDLHMERVYQDHELLVENLLLWTRDSKNKIYFTERPDKIAFFHNPENYLFSEDEAPTEYDDHSRSLLVEEFFSQAAKVDKNEQCKSPSIPNFAGHPAPQMEGPLYLKSDSKKGWKKYHFVLRSSGLYYFPKEKGKLLKDLVCLATFDVNEIYTGINWKKKFKAPTDYCFAIKHPKLQQPKSVKYIKFLCADDRKTLDKWIVTMRIAKYGRQLLENYHTLVEELTQDDLDQLAQARSCSVVSISKGKDSPNHSILENSQNQSIYNGGSISSGSDISAGRISRASSSSSSGCLSDGPYESEGNVFDSEYSTGTIKRKPSMKPNIPLTNMTRQLKEMVELASSQNSVESDHSTYSSSTGYTKTGTLTRGHSRQMSNQSNDDSIGSGTLKKHSQRPSQSSIESISSSRSSNSRSSTPVLVSSMQNTHLTNASRQSSPIIAVDTLQRSSQINKPFNGEMVQSSGVLMGYVANQTIVPTNKISWLPQNGHSIENSHESITNAPFNLEKDCSDFDLPLPPPPYSDSMTDVMFSSTFSLDSLPPPPVNNIDNTLSASQLSLVSLPPPPHPNEMLLPPPLETCQMNEMSLYEKIKESNGSSNNIYSTPQQLNYVNISASVSSPPQDHTKNLKTSSMILMNTPISNQFQQRVESNCEDMIDPSVVLRNSCGSVTPTSPNKRVKKIAFSLPPYDNTSPSKSSIPLKPTPPRRNETTRLSSPKRLIDSTSNPPIEFLKDLQKVMRKKWQVAQKCKLEPSTTPHEILGFREYPLQISEDYKETNVSNWVQEHYGHVGVGHTNIDNLYENSAQFKHADYKHSQNISGLQRNSDVRMSISKKKPPPPPPKRSENTQLTTVQPQKLR